MAKKKVNLDFSLLVMSTGKCCAVFSVHVSTAVRQIYFITECEV